MLDFWTKAASIATVAGVIIALVSIMIGLIGYIIQSRQNKLSLGVTIIRELEKQFDSEEMLKIRLNTANFLLSRQSLQEHFPPSEDLLDFFDGMGIYQEKGTIDLETTWVMFYFWLGHYWNLLKYDVDEFESNHSDVMYYKNIRKLYNKLTKFGNKYRNLPPDNVYFNETRLKNFLTSEFDVCTSRLREYNPPCTNNGNCVFTIVLGGKKIQLVISNS